MRVRAPHMTPGLGSRSPPLAAASAQGQTAQAVQSGVVDRFESALRLGAPITASSPGTAPRLDHRNALRHAMAITFSGEENPEEPHVNNWRVCAPHMAKALLKPPHELAYVLSYLDRPTLQSRLVELAHTLAAELVCASADVPLRAFVLKEAALRWIKARSPQAPHVAEDLKNLYKQLGTVETRRELSTAFSPSETEWMRTSLTQMLQRAGRFDRARTFAKKKDLFILSGAFVGLHIAVGGLLGIASTLALLFGGVGCFEFAFAFVAYGLALGAVWSIIYAGLWLFYQYAPWEIGTRRHSPTPQQAPSSSA